MLFSYCNIKCIIKYLCKCIMKYMLIITEMKIFPWSIYRFRYWVEVIFKFLPPFIFANICNNGEKTSRCPSDTTYVRMFQL